MGPKVRSDECRGLVEIKLVWSAFRFHGSGFCIGLFMSLYFRPVKRAIRGAQYVYKWAALMYVQFQKFTITKQWKNCAIFRASWDGTSLVMFFLSLLWRSCQTQLDIIDPATSDTDCWTFALQVVNYTFLQIFSGCQERSPRNLTRRRDGTQTYDKQQESRRNTCYKNLNTIATGI